MLEMDKEKIINGEEEGICDKIDYKNEDSSRI